MKSKVKYLVLAILFLVICSGLVTYAMFRITKNGRANVTAATWNVSFKNGSETLSNNFNIPLANATWTNRLGNVAPGKIAPGSQTTFNITVDATGTETDVEYDVVIGDMTAYPDFEVTVGQASGKINYSSNGNMIVQIPVTVLWDGGITDNAGKDDRDLALKNRNDITIPITITASQKFPEPYTGFYPTYYFFGQFADGIEGYEFPTTNTEPPTDRNLYLAMDDAGRYGYCIKINGDEHCYRYDKIAEEKQDILDLFIVTGTNEYGEIEFHTADDFYKGFITDNNISITYHNSLSVPASTPYSCLFMYNKSRVDDIIQGNCFEI